MAFAVTPDCIGCGACEFACPTGALRQSDSYLVTYWIDPLACDDCTRCVELCPVAAIVPDDAFAVCSGRGCPLASRRYGGWSCSRSLDRCTACGGVRWRTPRGEAICPDCRRRTGNVLATCPKPRQLARRELRAAASRPG